jgi:RimJ/RimL family protein N-acetyltransferase
MIDPPDPAAMDVVLETDRLILRRFTADDAELLIELDSDPEVMFYLTGGLPTPPEEARDDLAAMLRHYERWPGYGLFAAHAKADGAFLGWFELKPTNEGPQDEPELGYRLRKAAWGRGYATEGSIALVAKAFTDLGARRVFAETMTVHQASRSVMEKAGLKFVRTFFQDWPYPIEGEEHGDVEYALTREEWEAAAAAAERGER